METGWGGKDQPSSSGSFLWPETRMHSAGEVACSQKCCRADNLCSQRYSEAAVSVKQTGYSYCMADMSMDSIRVVCNCTIRFLHCFRNYVICCASLIMELMLFLEMTMPRNLTEFTELMGESHLLRRVVRVGLFLYPLSSPLFL